jgi:arylsulfatase A-like enzyme
LGRVVSGAFIRPEPDLKTASFSGTIVSRMISQFPSLRHAIVIVFFLILWGSADWAEAGAGPDQPNIILILADDLGYGDIGCYGSQRNLTPNIDRLASEGLRFTDFHSNGPMCTPTRAALLTGRYQHRLGPMFDGALSRRTSGDKGLPLEVRTLAEALKGHGYATGMYGKWHLGYKSPFVPTRNGFDRYRGLLSGDGDYHTQIDRFGNEDWWLNETLRMENGYTTDLLTKHSVKFIEENRKNPFFLYLAHLAIHFPWQGPDDPPHRVVKGKNYEKDKWGVIRDRKDVSSHVRDMVESLDRSVGEVVAALKRLGLEKNTLVFFTSDNGGYINYQSTHRNISSNGPLRGQKTQLFEGGHRVPAIAWWPGKIHPGVSEQTAMTFDLFPTALQLSGQSSSDSQLDLDGEDLTPLLLEGRVLPQRTLFWRMRTAYAVRKKQWKLVGKYGENPMLFQLDLDLGEQRDISLEYPGIVAELESEYQTWLKTVTRP